MLNGQQTKNIPFSALILKKEHITPVQKWKGEIWDIDQKIWGGYFPVPPVDSATDIRAEMVSTMIEMGLDMEKHHHEVAPSQHELGFKFGSLIESADNLQKYKYCVHMVAQAYGKTATFMPKPVYNDNGSGRVCYQSIWSKSGHYLPERLCWLSDTQAHYIGVLLSMQRLLMPFLTQQQIVIKD